MYYDHSTCEYYYHSACVYYDHSTCIMSYRAQVRKDQGLSVQLNFDAIAKSKKARARNTVVSTKAAGICLVQICAALQMHNETSCPVTEYTYTHMHLYH